MMGTLALVTVVGLPTVGVVLMAAMLIIPGAAARFWTDRLGSMLVIAAMIGAGSGVGGTMISAGALEQTLGFDPLAFGHNTRNLPTGPVIVLCAATLFLVSLLFAPRRGMLPRVARTLGGRRRIERENLLRSLYELSESRLPDRAVVPWQQIIDDRAWGVRQVRRLAGWGARRGLIERTASGPRLTIAGRQRAERLVRTHRLWELFLISGADIAPDHVDRDADSIEHFLTPQLVERLESQLAAEGKLPPVAGAVPDSPHELSTTVEPRAAEQGGRDG